MLKFGKTATPPTAETVIAPERVPPAGLLPIATVTLPTKFGTRFPCASHADTSTWGAIVTPAVAELGCTVNARRVAVPGVTLNGSLVAPVRPLAVANSV